MRFTDLLLASAGASLAFAAPCTKRAGKFLFTGSNEAGGEFGEGNLPGKLGTDYIWPETSSIDVCFSKSWMRMRIDSCRRSLAPA